MARWQRDKKYSKGDANIGDGWFDRATGKGRTLPKDVQDAIKEAEKSPEMKKISALQLANALTVFSDPKACAKRDFEFEMERQKIYQKYLEKKKTELEEQQRKSSREDKKD